MSETPIHALAIPTCSKSSPRLQIAPFLLSFPFLFPREPERRVLLIVGVCQTFSNLHIFTSHLQILTSSHPHIFTSSHLHIFTSSHLHILSCSLALLPSCSLALSFFLRFYFSLKARGSANETARNATLLHETSFDRQKLR